MSDKSNELIEYLDKKFQETAQKKDLDDLTFKLVTLEEFDGFKLEVKQEFAGLKESIQSLTVSLDRLVKAIDDLRIEYAAIIHQVDRHEKWVQQPAGKIGFQLEY